MKKEEILHVLTTLRTPSLRLLPKKYILEKRNYLAYCPSIHLLQQALLIKKR